MSAPRSDTIRLNIHMYSLRMRNKGREGEESLAENVNTVVNLYFINIELIHTAVQAFL